MAIVKPFPAIRYNLKEVELSRVIAPPYDVISSEQAEKLYVNDSHNIIRLELCQPRLENIQPEERYSHVSKCLKTWLKKGILFREKQAAFYLHEMTFQHPFLDGSFTRLALYGRLKLEPAEHKVVFPHERTHASPKVDRGRLLRATRTSFSPVFFLFEKTEDNKTAYEMLRQYTDKEPVADFFDGMSARNRFWVIEDPKHLDLFSSIFWGERLLIADGHHRYETALSYAEEMKKNNPDDESSDWSYVFGAFVAFDDPGLLILPIHRVIQNLPHLDRKALLDGIGKHFMIRPSSRKELEAISEGRGGQTAGGIGLAFSESECFVLQPKDMASAKKMMPEGKPDAWYGLDMNLVSYLILEPVLKIENSRLEEFVCYTPDTREVFQKLGSKSASCAFIIHPATCEMIKNVCESGDVMPQKSTYFYPKLPSGLVMYGHQE